MKYVLSVFGGILFYFNAYTQSVSYEVKLDNILHHELRISMEIRDVSDKPIVIKMANASPGRYATHQFAKNLYGEKAYDLSGKSIATTRTGASSWQVVPKNGYVRFEYLLYANHADGTYSGIDSEKILLNIPSAFVYTDDLPKSEITLKFDLNGHDTWSIATQLPEVERGTFTAPDFYYFMDSPILIGSLAFRSWEVDGKTIRIAALHTGSNEELDMFTDWTKAIVTQEKAVFGGLPRYDFDTYTFLCAYHPDIYGDGMEHRNSTVCSAPYPLKTAAGYLIGTIAHEFFHGWNIERIRPDDLEPFDFAEANVSEALWFGEGFTNYYEELILTRAGINSREKFLENLENKVNLVRNSPARQFRNPIQISQNAPYADAAVANDETNYANNYVSYYYYGEVLGAGLDLMLRTTFKDVTLDTYMRAVWEKFGKTEIPYTLEDLKRTLAEVTSDKSFAEKFFNQYIYKSELPDYSGLLEEFGITTSSEQRVNWGKPSIKNGVFSSKAIIGTPFYEAGIEKGDAIISINSMRISQDSDLEKLDLVIGNTYPIAYVHKGERRSGTFTAVQDPGMQFTFQESADKKAKDRQDQWLGPK